MSTPRLNLQIRGTNPTKPTVVLVHGVAGSLHIWDPIFDHLAEDYRVVRFDLLGYGYSPKPNVKYTPRRHVAAIRVMLREQGLKPPYTFVGLSMGVTIVLEYAALFPHEVASIVAIGYPFYNNGAEAREGLSHNVWAGLTINHPVIAQLVIPPTWRLARAGIIPPRLFAGIYSPIMAHETMLNPYRVFKSNIWNSMVHVDAGRLLSASAGTRRLFIQGGNDQWVHCDNVRRAVEPFAKSEFVCISNVEHNLVVLKPTKTLHLILDFLER